MASGSLDRSSHLFISFSKPAVSGVDSERDVRAGGVFWFAFGVTIRNYELIQVYVFVGKVLTVVFGNLIERETYIYQRLSN